MYPRILSDKTIADKLMYILNCIYKSTPSADKKYFLKTFDTTCLDQLMKFYKITQSF